MENLNFATRWNIDEVDANTKWLKEPLLSILWRIFLKAFTWLDQNLDLMEQKSIDETLKRTTSSNEDASEKHARLYGAIIWDIGHTQGTFDPIKEEVKKTLTEHGQAWV